MSDKRIKENPRLVPVTKTVEDSILEKHANDVRLAKRSERFEVLANWLRVDVEKCFTRSVDLTPHLCLAEAHLENNPDYPPCIRCQAAALAAFVEIQDD